VVKYEQRFAGTEKGDMLVRVSKLGEKTTVTVRKVGHGIEFDEPVYYLEGRFGVRLKQAYAGEELAEAGYILTAAPS
jgi:hypothetical protein